MDFTVKFRHYNTTTDRISHSITFTLIFFSDYNNIIDAIYTSMNFTVQFQKATPHLPPDVMVLLFLFILGSVMSPVLIMTSRTSHMRSLRPIAKTATSLVPLISDAQSLNFIKIFFCACVSVCTRTSSLYVAKCSRFECVPPLAMP